MVETATQFTLAAEEVESWVQVITQFWDDRASRDEQSRLSEREALRWHPARLLPL